MCLYGDDIKQRPTIQAANGKFVSSVEVFAAVMSHFKAHALHRINESSNGLDVKDSEVQWVVTVPAVWSPGAKQLMREAAKKAGLWDKIESQLVLALESEAASLCCRERELQVNAAQWKPGMQYLVMDLGGGTADFTVHKVTDTHALGEVIASSGGAWGSVYIEHEFMRLLEQIVGEDVMKGYHAADPRGSIELMIDFEALKHDVSASDLNEGKAKRIRLPVSLLTHVEEQTGDNMESLCADYADCQTASLKFEVKAAEIQRNLQHSGIKRKASEFEGRVFSALVLCNMSDASMPPPSPRLFASAGEADACVSYTRGQLKLSAALVSALFEPVVTQIVAHMNEVLSKAGAVSHIFMAGGFSESEVVKMAVQTAIGNRVIRLVIPPHAALAVLTGAVLFGLKPKVVSSRIVKSTYGVAVSGEWEPKTPRPQESVLFKPRQTGTILCGHLLALLFGRR